jgi:hypothetical protein
VNGRHLIYLPGRRVKSTLNVSLGLVVTKCDGPKNDRPEPFTWVQKQGSRGSIPISQFAFYGILGICYNLAFGSYPCPHDSNYPDLWNINYSEKERIYSTFYPSFTPNRYAGRFWPSCATIGQAAMRSSRKISRRPQHFIKFLGDHVLKKEREGTKHQFIHSDISDRENEPRKKTIMKRKG